MPTERIQVEGLRETLAAFKRFGPDAANELRTEAQKLSAQVVARQKAAGAGSDRTSAMAAGSVRARRDRTPYIVAGGRSKAGLVFFGAEFGGGRRKTTRQFRPHRGTTGYWFYPTLRAMTPKLLVDYGQALDRAARKWGQGG